MVCRGIGAIGIVLLLALVSSTLGEEQATNATDPRQPVYLTPERKRSNLLRDGSFEGQGATTWSLNSWRGDPRTGTMSREHAHDGRTSAVLHAAANDAWFSQRVAIKPDSAYLLSGWVRTANVVVVEKGGSTGANLALISEREHSESLVGTHDWTYLTHVFESRGRTTVEVGARLGYSYSTVTGSAWFDDLCLIEIGESPRRVVIPPRAPTQAAVIKRSSASSLNLGSTLSGFFLKLLPAILPIACLLVAARFFKVEKPAMVASARDFRLPLRCGISFSLVGLLAVTIQSLVPSALLFAFPLAGLVGALVFAAGVKDRVRAWTAALIMAVGLGITGLLVLFSQISLQAQVDPTRGATAWGFAFCLGGAISAVGLGQLRLPGGMDLSRLPRPWSIGGVMFGVAGAIAGALAFALFPRFGIVSLGLGVILAFLAGGVLMGIRWRSLASLVAHQIEDRQEQSSDQGYAYEPFANPRTSETPESTRSALDLARAAAIWGALAVVLPLLLATRPAWQFWPIEMHLTLLATIPLMLGIREPSYVAMAVLGLLGLPPLVSGWQGVRALKNTGSLAPARAKAMAWAGLLVGASCLLATVLLPIPPIGRLYDAWRGRVLLASATDPARFDTGNRIHEGNLLLGRAALRAGRTKDARAYLLAAGRTPGSPQLNSFGPDMRLAKEMLEAGQRETVLEYLTLCQSFWKGDEGRLNRWIQDITEGRTPDLGLSPRHAVVTDSQPEPKAEIVRVATVRDDTTRKEIRIIVAVVTEPDRHGGMKSHATHLKLDADFPLKADEIRGWDQPRLPTMTNRWLNINEYMVNSAGGNNMMRFRLAGDGKENFGWVRLSYFSGAMSGPPRVSISSLERLEVKSFADGQNGIHVVIPTENRAKIGAHWWVPGSTPVLSDM